MAIQYHASSDTLTIRISAAAAEQVEEVRQGVFLLSDSRRRLVGIRVEGARARVDLTDVADSPRDTTPRTGEKAAAVTIFSDGACSGNPGPGGWAARLKYADGRVVEIGGPVAATTNNRMELYAAIQGLKKAGPLSSITMRTDSEYLRRGITEWIHGWKRRGWLTAAKKPVLNQDLWRELDRLNGPHVTWQYIRGHAGDPDNERCDEIAQAFSRGEKAGSVDS